MTEAAGALDAPLAGVPGALAPLLARVADALVEGARERGGPVPAGGPPAVAAAVRAALGRTAAPDVGVGAENALSELTRLLAAGASDPVDPACAAHLHCPPLAVAVAADVAVAALNQSMDSWDQAPAATVIEQEVVAALAALAGYSTDSAGVLTGGGTESNLMGLLLARDAGADPMRIFCSPYAHFTIARNAMILGLGADSVTTVPVDAESRMDPRALRDALESYGGRPVVVATAGTTDLGTIDPLADITAIAAKHRAWVHVDAAYGGGALFSRKLRALLDGIQAADSIGLDLHKIGWQPAPAGIFLARDRDAFAPLAMSAAYLNPADDEEAGFPSLLGLSLRTTRRADAFRIAVTFRALGIAVLGELVDACHALTEYAAAAIADHPKLELLAPPVLTTVAFRYRGSSEANARLRRRLIVDGTAVVGRTERDGETWLKLTLLNPYAKPADIDRVLAAVAEAGTLEARR
ncbi:pyridoxal phosphate-dependent decarboxylase family protein [Fodinicola acaciae]|uniref:pyridoxal phosphate-dependent decarboxylase family protein n=1 Tax=Fodinicola acaciae TaxID=2681555 RepID=UPI001C9E52F9|nr:aspartate aminotransferase family protein [Fodinicola acaciae]